MTEGLDLAALPWRVGRSQGRTIYAQTGPEPSKTGDVLIGVLDTRKLAMHTVRVHNTALAADCAASCAPDEHHPNCSYRVMPAPGEEPCDGACSAVSS